MTITKPFKELVVERIQREPEFAKALLQEAAFLMFNGEPDTARLVLRDLVNGTIGFEKLASLTSKPSKSLHRMLSVKGNPTMDNLNAILTVLCQHLKVNVEVSTVSSNVNWDREQQLSKNQSKMELLKNRIEKYKSKQPTPEKEVAFEQFQSIIDGERKPGQKLYED